MQLQAPISHQAFDPVKLIEEAAHLNNRKQIYQIIEKVAQLIKNPQNSLTLQKKAGIAKKAFEIEKNYKDTHSIWSRIVNIIGTKLLHIHTDYDIIDGLHQIEVDLDKNHLFIHALQEGDITALKDLLDAGISPNTMTKKGKSALLIAAESGQIEVMNVLLNAGADIDIVHEDNKTTLMQLVTKKTTPHNRAVIEYLVSHGANINIQDSKWGYTALHWSIVSGQIENLQILLQDGADANILSFNKLPPLLEATQRDQVSAIRILVQFGALLNAQNAKGNTALHDCAQPFTSPDSQYIQGKLEAVKTLLEAGADPYIENKSKKIPLDLSSEQDRNIYPGNEVAEMFFTLLKAGTKEDNVETDRRKEFARQCIDFEKLYAKKMEYKKILLRHTDWIKESEISSDVEYQKILLEDKVPHGLVFSIQKSNFKKDIIVKIGNKDYAVNGILLELESGFISTLQSLKGVGSEQTEYAAIHLYDNIPDFISNQEFELVMKHIEGIEELKELDQINPTYFHLKPFSKIIPHFSELWDNEKHQPKIELADRDILFGESQKIKVHKSVIGALNQDFQIDFIVQADSKTIKDLLQFLYTTETTHLQSEKEVIDVANLCNEFKIDKYLMTRLGSRYYELALPKLLVYPDPSTSLTEKEKFVLKNLPVGRLLLNAFPTITPEQFLSIIRLMPSEFVPQIECSQCFKLRSEDLKAFEEIFNA
jgi:ankyrin repeat protein